MEDNFIDFFNKISSDKFIMSEAKLAKYDFEKKAFIFSRKPAIPVVKKARRWPWIVGGGALGAGLAGAWTLNKFFDLMSRGGMYPMYNPNSNIRGF